MTQSFKVYLFIQNHNLYDWLWYAKYLPFEGLQMLIAQLFLLQIVAYLLISSASSAIPLTNRMREGSDNIFTDASAAAISMSIFAFLSLAASALISGYKLSTQPYIWRRNCAKLSLLLFHTFILLYKSHFSVKMRKGLRPHLFASVHILNSEIWYWFNIPIHVMFNLFCIWNCLLTSLAKKEKPMWGMHYSCLTCETQAIEVRTEVHFVSIAIKDLTC